MAFSINRKSFFLVGAYIGFLVGVLWVGQIKSRGELLAGNSRLEGEERVNPYGRKPSSVFRGKRTLIPYW